MADVQPNRIKTVKTTFATLPPPPELAKQMMSGKVLLASDAAAFDAAQRLWWEKVVHILKTQWMQEEK